MLAFLSEAFQHRLNQFAKVAIVCASRSAAYQAVSEPGNPFLCGEVILNSVTGWENPVEVYDDEDLLLKGERQQTYVEEFIHIINVHDVHRNWRIDLACQWVLRVLPNGNHEAIGVTEFHVLDTSEVSDLFMAEAQHAIEHASQVIVRAFESERNVRVLDDEEHEAERAFEGMSPTRH
jgi:hypothetical protein